MYFLSSPICISLPTTFVLVVVYRLVAWSFHWIDDYHMNSAEISAENEIKSKFITIIFVCDKK